MTRLALDVEIAKLRKLRDLALDLGFMDDYNHWKSELKKLGIEE